MSLYETLRDALRADQPIVFATVTEVARDRPEASSTAPGSKLLARPGQPPLGDLGDPDLSRIVGRDAIAALDTGRTSTRRYGWHGEARGTEVSVFIEAFVPQPRMIVFGAVDFTAALTRVAKILGYRVTVCDARPTFATHARFPVADEVVVDWPDRYLAKVGSELSDRDAICVLTHDQKFDVPAIVSALETEVGYIGAMGSRRTNANRRARLLEAGVDEVALQRVMAPIGLDIGARTPEETAISICAEIIALRAAREVSGGKTLQAPAATSLRESGGPIHWLKAASSTGTAETLTP